MVQKATTVVQQIIYYVAAILQGKYILSKLVNQLRHLANQLKFQN